jgi:hypothetical protein
MVIDRRSRMSEHDSTMGEEEIQGGSTAETPAEADTDESDGDSDGMDTGGGSDSDGSDSDSDDTDA